MVRLDDSLARYTEDERQRPTVRLPDRALTLRLDEVERGFRT
jgi:hypothetical protein